MYILSGARVWLLSINWLIKCLSSNFPELAHTKIVKLVMLTSGISSLIHFCTMSLSLLDHSPRGRDCCSLSLFFLTTVLSFHFTQTRVLF